MKKYIGTAALIITLFAFSVQQAEAMSLSSIFHSIFGTSTVSNSNLGASAIGAFTNSASTTTTNVIVPVKTTLAAAATSVTVTSPNGGETYTLGQQLPITWTSVNIPSSNNHVSIVLHAYKNGVDTKDITLKSLGTNTGNLSVALPTTAPAGFSLTGLSYGNNFKISVTITDANNNVLGSDYSNSYFAINAASSTVSSTSLLNIKSGVPVSGYLNTKILVGAQNIKAGDLRIVTGAGGTVPLSGVNVAMYNRGTGDYQLSDYASSVSIWLNGVQIGSLPATSFTQSNKQYSAFIPVSSAILNPNTTNDLQIALSALPVISSNDLNPGANNFAFEFTSVGYFGSTSSTAQYYPIPASVSFDGGNLVSGTLQSSAVFTSAASTNSADLTISRDPNDYNNHVVAGQTNSTTTNIPLATIDLAAKNSAVTINRLPVSLVTSTGTASTLIGTLRLYNSAGTQIDSEYVSGASPAVVTFQNLNTTIPAGSTQVFTIKGDLNAIDGTKVVNGATAQVDLTAQNVAAINAYDQNNTVLSGTSALQGSTTGSTITFYVNGIQVSSTASSGTATASIGGSLTHSILGFTIPFSVTAFGQNAYLPSIAKSSVTASATNAIQFCVDTFTGACQAVGSGVITYSGSDNLVPDSNGNYVIPTGQTKNFQLQITTTGNGPASYRATLLNVSWNTTNSASAYNIYTSGLNTAQFRTNYVSGQ